MDAVEVEDPLTTLRERYLAAQLRGDRREALRVITDEGLARGIDAISLQRLVADAQREIGRLWQENRISIAEEHVATALSQLALSVIYQHAAHPSSNGKRVIVACVEGELHDFPARLVADALDLSGFDVRFLGANVPVRSLLGMLDKERPDLLCLSVTMLFHVPAARSMVREVRAHTEGHLPIAIGGGACEWSQNLAEELGAEVTGTTAEELVRSAKRLLQVAS